MCLRGREAKADQGLSGLPACCPSAGQRRILHLVGPLAGGDKPVKSYSIISVVTAHLHGEGHQGLRVLRVGKNNLRMKGRG